MNAAPPLWGAFLAGNALASPKYASNVRLKRRMVTMVTNAFIVGVIRHYPCCCPMSRLGFRLVGLFSALFGRWRGYRARALKKPSHDLAADVKEKTLKDCFFKMSE